MKDKTPTEKKLKQLKKESIGITLLTTISVLYGIFLVVIIFFDLAALAFASSFETTHTPTRTYIATSQLVLTIIALKTLRATTTASIAITLALVYSIASLLIWWFCMRASTISVITLVALLVQIVNMFIYVLMTKVTTKQYNRAPQKKT